uniref:Integrase catalytic domain-containing protein n=1 Tax=Tanacetum cinerariifolium TaxID=118510 RepID=A0A699GI30_TANCI|nr:hypothetical protein [Tanacetum cinerariifolium]
MYYHFLRPRLGLDYGLYPLNVDANVLEMAKYVKGNKIILVYVEHESSNVDSSIFVTPKKGGAIAFDNHLRKAPIEINSSPDVNRNLTPMCHRNLIKDSVKGPFIVETVDPFDGLDEILGDYANTREEITKKQMIVHVGNSFTVEDVLDYDMLFETEEVGCMGNFKEVEVDADNETEEEINIEENDISGSDSEDLDYDPKHGEVFDDDEHIIEDVPVSIYNFNFNPNPKHDLSIAGVEVYKHDLDVIDYDSFGSDLDDGIDSERRIQLRELKRICKEETRGLLQAIAAVFRSAEHRYRVKHIHENMKSPFRGSVYKDMLWNAARATTVVEFNKKMGQLKSYNSAAYNWKWELIGIPCKHDVTAIYNMYENGMRVGNSHVQVSTDTNKQIRVLPPKTAEEILARERERKARTTLLMAIPEDHLAKFHKITDAKEMWETIKSKFDRNDESKKMQKYILKQQFEGFSVSNSEGLHKGYDRFQSLLSQLEIHGAGLSTEDANQKFLRSLPSSWSQLTLIMRTKPGVDTLSFDDLYNNLRVFESNVKVSTASSSSTQNVAFVSSDSTNSTKEVSAPYGVFTSSGYNSQKEGSSSYTDDLMYSLFANQSSGPKLDYKDLEQFEERRDAGNTGYKARDNGRRPAKQDEHKAMVTIDGEGVDWTSHAKDDTKNYVLMAFNSINSGSDTEVTSCSKECENTYAKLKKLYDEQREQLGVASIEIQAYTLALKKMSAKDKSGLGYGTQIHEGVLSYENKVLESVFDSRSSDVEDSPVNDRFAKLERMHAVPPPMTWIYMPPKPDFRIDESKFTYGPKQSKNNKFDAKTSDFASCESNSSVETLKSVPKPDESKPKAVSEPKVWFDAPIIEEQTIKDQDTCSQNPKVPKRDWTGLKSKILGLGYGYTRKACFVYGSFSHLIRDCDFHEKRMAKQVELNKRKNKVTCQRNNRLVWNNVQRLNHQNKFVPTAILTKTGRFSVNAARQKFSSQTVSTSTVRKVNTARPIVNEIKPRNNVYKSHLPIIRPFNITTAPKANFANYKVNTIGDKTVSAIGGNQEAAVKTSDNPHQTLKGKGIVDSECSRHMTGNKAYLVEYQDFNGVLVVFGGSKGQITGKGKIRTGKLDFEDVYFVKELQHFNLFSVSQMYDKKNKVKTIRCDNGTEFKNKDIIEFCASKGIKRVYSNARTPQQNGVAETKNIILIKAAKTMLADLFLPNTFWAEGVSTACYVLNRVLVTKPQNKTPYELITGKFEEKSDEGFLVGYSLNSKAFSLLLERIKLINVGPKEANNSLGTQDNIDAGNSEMEAEHIQEYCVLPLWSSYTSTVKSSEAKNRDEKLNGDTCSKRTKETVDEEDQAFLEELARLKRQEKEADDAAATLRKTFANINTASLLRNVSAARPSYLDLLTYANQHDSQIPSLEDIYEISNDGIFTNASYDDEGAMVDFTTLESTVNMDVKSVFLYGKIDEEVYVSQPPGFIDHKFPKKVYKVIKALYGLHQAPKAWYATLSTFLKSWCDEFETLMKSRFQMSSMGELTFFLGLHGKQREDEIFISQDKYVAEILKKFDFMSVKTASNPIETKTPLVKDAEAADVDVHLYRSMIGSLMYLTASRLDIMYAVCACSSFQVTSKTSRLHAMKRIFRYLKGQPKLGLWYPRESSFDLEANSNSDYAGANLDRKSTTGGCQFLGRILISWQCKKQTIVATLTTKAEYVATASCWSYTDKVKVINAEVEGISAAGETLNAATLTVSTVNRLNVKCFENQEAKMGMRKFFKCWFHHHTTNGHQFTMSNRHQELASPKANGFCKELASTKQMDLGKDFSNPLMADSLPKTIWLSMHHVIAMKHWLFQSKRLLAKETTFSVLSCMAMDILSVQATLVASESAFSTSGRVLSIRRTRLTPASLEMCMCLKDHLDAQERKQDKSTLETPVDF